MIMKWKYGHPQRINQSEDPFLIGIYYTAEPYDWSSDTVLLTNMSNGHCWQVTTLWLYSAMDEYRVPNRFEDL